MQTAFQVLFLQNHQQESGDCSGNVCRVEIGIAIVTGIAQQTFAAMYGDVSGNISGIGEEFCGKRGQKNPKGKENCLHGKTAALRNHIWKQYQHQQKHQIGKGNAFAVKKF